MMPKASSQIRSRVGDYQEAIRRAQDLNRRNQQQIPQNSAANNETSNSALQLVMV